VNGAHGSPDPLADPKGYVEHLLGLLGGDDPSEVQRSTPSAWRALVDAGGDAVTRRPEPSEWSVLECLGHALDAEIVSSNRYRWALAQDRPSLPGYDQDLWVDRLRHGEDEPELLLAAFAALRSLNLSLWQRSSDDDRSRVGVHVERGPESYDLMFRMIAGHDRFHLAQARRALDVVPR
jgi:hypothetical protein